MVVLFLLVDLFSFVSSRLVEKARDWLGRLSVMC